MQTPQYTKWGMHRRQLQLVFVKVIVFCLCFVGIVEVCEDGLDEFADCLSALSGVGFNVRKFINHGLAGFFWSNAWEMSFEK